MKAEGGFLHTLVRSTAIGQFSSTTWEFAVKLLESQSYDIHLQNNYGVSALHEVTRLDVRLLFTSRLHFEATIRRSVPLFATLICSML